MRCTRNTSALSFIEMLPVLIPYFIGFFVFKGVYSIFPIYLQIKNNYSSDEIVNIWAIIGGIALTFGAITRIPAGLLSDKIGRKKAIFLAYIIYLIGVLLLFSGDMLILSFLSITFFRVGLNLFAMSGRGVVSVAKREKGLKNGLLSAMVGTGSLLGPIALSVVMEKYYIDAIIWLILIFIIIDALLFVFSLKLVPFIFNLLACESSMELDLDPINNTNNFSSTQGFFIPGIRHSIFLFLLSGMIYGLVSSIYSIYGYNILSINVTTIGLITGIGSSIQIIWAPLTGWAYMRFKDEIIRKLAWIGIVIATITLSLSKLGIIFYIMGFFILVMMNSSFATMEITRMGRLLRKEDFSLVFGTATSLVILGSAISSYISRALYAISTEGTFYLSILLAIVALLSISIRK